MINILLASLSDFNGIWGVLGVLFGGTAVKVIEYFITRNRTKVDDATAIRLELRSEIREINAEKDALDKALDEWKEKYWAEHEKLVKMSARLAFLISKLEGCESTVPPELLKTFRDFVDEYYGASGGAARVVPAIKLIEQTIKEVEAKPDA